MHALLSVSAFTHKCLPFALIVLNNSQIAIVIVVLRDLELSSHLLLLKILTVIIADRSFHRRRELIELLALADSLQSLLLFLVARIPCFCHA